MPGALQRKTQILSFKFILVSLPSNKLRCFNLQPPTPPLPRHYHHHHRHHHHRGPPLPLYLCHYCYFCFCYRYLFNCFYRCCCSHHLYHHHFTNITTKTTAINTVTAIITVTTTTSTTMNKTMTKRKFNFLYFFIPFSELLTKITVLESEGVIIDGNNMWIKSYTVSINNDSTRSWTEYPNGNAAEVISYLCIQFSRGGLSKTTLNFLCFTPRNRASSRLAMNFYYFLVSFCFVSFHSDVLSFSCCVFLC